MHPYYLWVWQFFHQRHPGNEKVFANKHEYFPKTKSKPIPFVWNVFFWSIYLYQGKIFLPVWSHFFQFFFCKICITIGNILTKIFGWLFFSQNGRIDVLQKTQEFSLCNHYTQIMLNVVFNNLLKLLFTLYFIFLLYFWTTIAWKHIWEFFCC